ncbi:redoxin domain-containing protein [Ponticaulis koreensis]|uniref:redoxin domain-containing protein n=1 Tax=Ponticaulis koreensis TaxID=1123045 RepID=UPI0003B5BAFA|nr:redoxin domain-containing protein [Ponticaulis koreensis]
MRKIFAFTASAFALSALTLSAEASPTYVDNFRLVDHERVSHELYYYQDAPAIVLMTVTADSDFAMNAVEAFAELRDEYAAEGVRFYLINPDATETRTQMSDAMAAAGVDMPVLMDARQLVSESLSLQTTGEVLVINPRTGFQLAYRGPVNGRIDGRGRTPYVANALDALISGEAVEVTSVEMRRGDSVELPHANTSLHQSISYSEDVAPILVERCGGCHVAGGIAPWELADYETIQGWAPMIREVIRTDRMPPYFPDFDHAGTFFSENELSPEEARTIVHWIEAGAPRGEGEDPLINALQPLPEWPLGEPDYIVEVTPFDIPATGILEYEYPTIPNQMEEGRWLRATHVRPGSNQGVHHVTSGYIQNRNAAVDEIEGNLPSGSVGSYTPGQNPQEFHEGVGTYLSPGGAFRFSMHYTTFGLEETDRTQVGLYFHDEPPELIMRSTVIGDSNFVIPAGEENFHITSYTLFPADAELYTLYPHAHYRGKRVELSIEYPDGTSELLLSLPRYDFNWQRDYDPVDPIQVPAGSRLVADWWYDNSDRNFANPDPAADVYPGDQTHEEMMYFRVNYRWLDETRENITNYTEIMQQDRLFASLDDSRDDMLQPAEIVGQRNVWLASGFDGYDTNNDGLLDREEYQAALPDRPARRRGPAAQGVNEFGDIDENVINSEENSGEADMTSLDTPTTRAGVQ